MAEAFIYWGIGHDDGGFYIAAFLHYPQGDKHSFKANLRFSNPQEAFQAMEALARGWDGLAHTMGLTVRNRILEEE